MKASDYLDDAQGDDGDAGCQEMLLEFGLQFLKATLEQKGNQFPESR